MVSSVLSTLQQRLMHCLVIGAACQQPRSVRVAYLKALTTKAILLTMAAHGAKRLSRRINPGNANPGIPSHPKQTPKQ
eukprot:2625387-Amphidinium_carterae.1